MFLNHFPRFGALVSIWKVGPHDFLTSSIHRRLTSAPISTCHRVTSLVPWRTDGPNYRILRPISRTFLTAKSAKIGTCGLYGGAFCVWIFPILIHVQIPKCIFWISKTDGESSEPMKHGVNQAKTVSFDVWNIVFHWGDVKSLKPIWKLEITLKKNRTNT